MTAHGTTTNVVLRAALLEILACGRAVTTTELRTRLQHRADFGGLPQETVYRHLDALARAGRVRRVRPPGKRHIYWVARAGGVSAALPAAAAGRVPGGGGR